MALLEDLAEAAPGRAAGSWRVTVLFTATSFVGAGLLFMVQPMVAKLVLPSYGGSATVWSTASLFFQLTLLFSYAWTHWSSRFGPRQPLVQVLVLLVPVVSLPLALPSDAAPGSSTDPAIWLLRTLLLMVGLPFAALACTGPLTQKWYSWTGARGASDPYFLYAASNAGSFIGLLSYPFLIEPHLSLSQQRWTWSLGYVGFLLLSGACGFVALRHHAAYVESRPVATSPRPSGRLRLTWALLAFVPASLSLAVTAHLSTDVAPIPLLWVLPLAIYLATFVAAFARKTRAVPARAARYATALALVAAATASSLDQALSFVVGLSLLAVAGYVGHARLASLRPDPEHLTGFYVVVATGGALGGLLNGLVAPALFDRVWEYPLMLLAVPLLCVRSGSSNLLTRRFPTPVAVVCLGVVVFLGAILARVLGKPAQPSFLHAVGLLLALAAVATLVSWASVRPLVVLVVAALVLTGLEWQTSRGTMHHLRSFFAAYRVVDTDGMHLLDHGSTTHGSQFQDAARRDEPTTYYGGPGSCRDVFELLSGRLHHVGVVGLGAGTIATYGEPGEQLTFFEVDQQMVDLAQDPRYFSFVADSKADVHMVVGDGRLEVGRQPDASFDLLVLDAFSSDSIPTHLLTSQAFATYAAKVAPDGVLLVHISNRLFDLEPVVASAARHLGWEATVGTSDGTTPGTVGSTWVALTRDPSVTAALRTLPHWRPIQAARTVDWTDDYSSVLAVIK